MLFLQPGAKGKEGPTKGYFQALSKCKVKGVMAWCHADTNNWHISLNTQTHTHTRSSYSTMNIPKQLRRRTRHSYVAYLMRLEVELENYLLGLGLLLQHNKRSSPHLLGGLCIYTSKHRPNTWRLFFTKLDFPPRQTPHNAHIDLKRHSTCPFRLTPMMPEVASWGAVTKMVSPLIRFM